MTNKGNGNENRPPTSERGRPPTSSAPQSSKPPKEPKITGAEKKQHRLFKKRRGGVVLTEDEVKEIKAKRKELRKDMRAQGIKSKKEFELTASSMGLYFDKNRLLGLLRWFLWSKGGWLLLGMAALLMLALYAFSYITQLQGHFTINMSDDLFLEGFTLDETPEFQRPSAHLFATPMENVPCVSIVDIPDDVDGELYGQHNGTNYFAYTYFIRNEGNSTQGYRWEIRLNSESKQLSKAAWVMIFEDGEMAFYAKPDENGSVRLPAEEDPDFAYVRAPLYQFAKHPEDQYEVIKQTESFTYWRLVPYSFLSENVVAQGMQEAVKPMEVHKYTIVVWLEGDDPDCTNELVGGHLGIEIYMELLK